MWPECPLLVSEIPLLRSLLTQLWCCRLPALLLALLPFPLPRTSPTWVLTSDDLPLLYLCEQDLKRGTQAFVTRSVPSFAPHPRLPLSLAGLDGL